MCGIAGILGAEDQEAGRRMGELIAHRGPDGHGVWSDAGVTLVHQRLSIVDLEGGAQPMESHDGRYCIVYNGEVYNHAVLRAELEQHGHTFKTDHSDTETILEGYRRWGQSVAERLEGMFAFAIWDTAERKLVLARDPFGIKPLFLAVRDGRLYFASEVKALLGLVPFRPDLDHVKERAALEFLTGQATLFEGVEQLPPGTWVALDGPTHPVPWTPYYSVARQEYANVDGAAADIVQAFQESVLEQRMSDVPIGVVLSGGLDSAVVAATLREAMPDARLQTFTIAESEEVEDVQAAQRVADHLGTEHHVWTFDEQDLWDGLAAFAWHNENINYTEYFFRPLFDQVARHVKVALCGQGSDELWGGYARYRDPRALATLRLQRLLQAWPSHGDALASQIVMAHQSGPSLAEWDQQGQLSNFQLRLVDRNSMASGVEVRVPFLSRRLHAASRAVPWGWKLHGDPPVEKWILRHALRGVDLPEDLLWRPKVPAGRATSPTVMQRFEHKAAGHQSRKAPFLEGPDALLFDLFSSTFEAGGPRGVTAEALL